MSRSVALLACMLLLTACGTPDVSIGLEIPTKVKADEHFNARTTIFNKGGVPVSLYSIDFDATIHSGFSFVSSQPSANALEDMPLEGKRVSFNKLIEPDNRLTVSMTLRAGTPGKYSSDFSICVDAKVFCDFNDIDIEVVP